MRKLFGLVAALGLVLSTAQPAHAAPQALTSASLTVLLGTFSPIYVPWLGTGGANLMQTPTGTAILGLTPGIFAFSGSSPVDPTSSPIVGVDWVGVGNGTGNFAFNFAGSGGGLMAVTGAANICVNYPNGGGDCSTSPTFNITVPFTQGPGVNGIGLGGAPIEVPGFISVTVAGNGWTTGTFDFGAPGFVQSGSPLSDGGHVKLISPVVVYNTNPDPAKRVIPGFAILELNLVPEPGTLLLLASGVAGLAMVGRKRMSK
jgi:hypothetical protein